MAKIVKVQASNYVNVVCNKCNTNFLIQDKHSDMLGKSYTCGGEECRKSVYAVKRNDISGTTYHMWMTLEKTEEDRERVTRFRSQRTKQVKSTNTRHSGRKGTEIKDTEK